jgi:hypothetical protein
MGIMHVEADLLNYIRNIWSCECQIKSSSEAAEVCGSRCRHRCPLSGSYLRVGVNWRGAGLAFRHPSMTQNVYHVPSLREEETVATTLNLHTEEVMQGTKILHGEFLLKC